jgi:hypothetical protein
VAACALALGACGAQPPQAPVPEANRAAAAITGIMEACGEAYQARGPRGAGPSEPPAPASEAATRAAELAGVYRHGPEWIYSGVTLRGIVALSVRQLRECGLRRAARQLLRSTR